MSRRRRGIRRIGGAASGVSRRRRGIRPAGRPAKDGVCYRPAVRLQKLGRAIVVMLLVVRPRVRAPPLAPSPRAALEAQRRRDAAGSLDSAVSAAPAGTHETRVR